MKRIIFLLFFCLECVHFPAAAIAGGPPEIDIAELQQQIHQQINRERQKHGLALLDWDGRLAGIAFEHSRDMATQNFFSHINLQGENSGDRSRRHGWNEKKRISPNTWIIGVAENIFLSHLYSKVITTTQNGVTIDKEYLWNSPEQIVQSVVKEWMDSPEHRKNILFPQYDRQGIGIAISGNNIYVTENLF